MNPVALVTGGRGFVGAFIVTALREAGWQVRTLTRPAGRTLAADEVPGDFTEMTSPADWSSALDGVSVVINAAGILREAGRQTFTTIHHDAPLALARACAEKDIRFVQLSALGHPEDGGFVASKHRFDAALLALPINAVVLRPSVVYAHRGAYGGTSLLRALAAFPGRHLLPGDGHWPFQPVGADDLAQVVVAACSRGDTGIHEVGAPEPISLKQYQETWRRWLRIPGTRAWQVPLPLVKAQVAIGHALGRGPINRTIWNMLVRGNTTQPDAHEQVATQFGVNVRGVSDTLAEHPSQLQDRTQAQLYFLTPWLKWSIVLVWLMSAVAGFVISDAAIQQLAQSHFPAHLHPVALTRALAGIDLLLGLALALGKRPRPVILIMLAFTVCFFLTLAFTLPVSLIFPLGGLVKNLALMPALAMLWVLSGKR